MSIQVTYGLHWWGVEMAMVFNLEIQLGDHAVTICPYQLDCFCH